MTLLCRTCCQCYYNHSCYSINLFTMSATELQPKHNSTTGPPKQPSNNTPTVSNNTQTESNDTTPSVTVPNLTKVHNDFSSTLQPYIHTVRTRLQSFFNTAAVHTDTTLQTVDNELQETAKYTQYIQNAFINQIQDIRADRNKSLQVIAGTSLFTALCSYPFGKRFVFVNTLLVGLSTAFIINPYQTRQRVVDAVISTDAMIHNVATKLNEQPNETDLIKQQFLPCGCPVGNHVPHSTFGNLNNEQDAKDVIAYLKQT